MKIRLIVRKEDGVEFYFAGIKTSYQGSSVSPGVEAKWVAVSTASEKVEYAQVFIMFTDEAVRVTLKDLENMNITGCKVKEFVSK